MPQDDVDKLCIEIAQAMYEKGRPPSRRDVEWEHLPPHVHKYWLDLARIAMEMIGIHLKTTMMDVWWGGTPDGDISNQI